MSKVKTTMTMSLDGFVAGPSQSAAEPLGVGGMKLHQWLLPLKAFRERHGEEGGEVNASTPVAEEILGNVGATIMGRNMFGGGPGPWGDDPWKGYWGDDPPFHHPVFVLTRHPREPLLLEGGTSFCFVTGGVESALDQARAAAGDRDVSIGGGASETAAATGRGDRGAWRHAHSLRARMSHGTWIALHVLGAAVFLGNLIVTALWKTLADRTGNPSVIAYGQRLVTITDLAFTATGAALLTVSGFVLASDWGGIGGPPG